MLQNKGAGGLSSFKHWALHASRCLARALLFMVEGYVLIARLMCINPHFSFNEFLVECAGCGCSLIHSILENFSEVYRHLYMN